MNWTTTAIAVLGLLLAGPAHLAQAQTEDETAASGPERRSRLQGTAYVDRRTDVVGVVVRVNLEGDDSRFYLTSTDQNGVFRVDGLADGMYAVHLERDGYESVLKSDVSLRFPFRAVVEVLMRPAAGDVYPAVGGYPDPSVSTPTISFSGTLIERNGEPISDARIRLTHPMGQRDPRVVRSTPEGRFEITDLAAGPWELQVLGVGYLPLSTELDLAADIRLDFVLVTQPPDYLPLPLELLPPERLVPPPGMNQRPIY